jgi:Fusaric acid resistance protein-like
VIYIGRNVLAFGAAIFLLGLFCAWLGRVHQRLPQYLDRTAYRYGSIALAIVMLVVRDESDWVVALHRFIEVSIGIAVGLAWISTHQNKPNKC